MKKSSSQLPKIVICDDDEGILEVVKIILSEAGFSVFPVMPAENIFEQISAIQPQLILLDLWMPHMNGQLLTQKLKTDHLTKDIPIILLSAHNELSDTARSLQVEYLAKPFDLDVLVSKVEAQLKHEKCH